MKTYKKRGVILFIAFFLLFVFSYGFLIEPKGQSVSYETIRVDNLPVSWENAKIAFFSDLNIGKDYTIDSLKKTVKRINEASPDVIIFAGNFFDTKDDKKQLSTELENALADLQAPLGKYAMLSEENQTDQATEILTKADFQILANQNRQLYRYSLEPLNIIAMNKKVTAEQKQTLLASSKESTSILLNEDANSFSELTTQQNIQLMFSYNTYGGFIGLPYLNTQLAKTNYPSGRYTNDNQTLLVSNGIGTPSNAYFRLFNAPTLYIITLQQRR